MEAWLSFFLREMKLVVRVGLVLDPVRVGTPFLAQHPCTPMLPPVISVVFPSCDYDKSLQKEKSVVPITSTLPRLKISIFVFIFL